MQQQSEQEGIKSPIKSWLRARALQWLDGTMSNLLTGITLASTYWFAKHLWGLAFIPFSVLDAILLSLIVAIVIIFVIILFIYYTFKYGWKIIAVFIGLFALMSILADKRSFIFQSREVSAQDK